MKNKKVIIEKLKRFFGITKPIELSETEKKWVLLCKGHFNDKYPKTGNWVETLKPMFEEVYGWSANEYYSDYLNCMFGKLLDIFLKIQDDQSGNNHQLRSIFYSSFEKSMVRDQERPIERAIAELCGQIQCTAVINNDVKRFNLELKQSQI